MAVAALAAATVLGGAFQAIGTLEAGDEAKLNGEKNASLLRQNAGVTVTAAEADVRDLERRSALLRGRTIASAAASGTTLSGNVGDLLDEQAVETAIDRLRITFLRDIRVERLNFQADEIERAGRVAQKQSRLGAFAGLLGTGARTAAITQGGR